MSVLLAETVTVSSAHNAVLISINAIRSVVNFFIIVMVLNSSRNIGITIYRHSDILILQIPCQTLTPV